MKRLKIAFACMGLAAAGACAFTLRPALEVRAESAETAVEAPAPEKSGWERFVAEYLTADKAAMYMSWVAYVGTIVGLAANIAKLKKANSLTLKNVSDEVKAALAENVGEEVKKQTERFLPSVLATQEKTNEILKSFSKILALSQENTPESRVAILNVIEELGTIGKEAVEAGKEAIAEEVKAIEEKKEEAGKRLDAIIDRYDGTSI